MQSLIRNDGNIIVGRDWLKHRYCDRYVVFVFGLALPKDKGLGKQDYFTSSTRIRNVSANP